MKRALLAGAVIAASFFTPAAATAAEVGVGMIVIHGRGPAHDCYVAAAQGREDRSSIALCDLALNHDFLTREDRAATFVNRGVLWLRRGADERALADFEGAAAIVPAFGEAHLMRGAALVQLERYQDAIESLTLAMSLNPERPERAYFYRAAAYEELGDARAAYDDYQRAAELDPGWRAPAVELARFRVG